MLVLKPAAVSPRTLLAFVCLLHLLVHPALHAAAGVLPSENGFTAPAEDASTSVRLHGSNVCGVCRAGASAVEAPAAALPFAGRPDAGSFSPLSVFYLSPLDRLQVPARAPPLA